MSIGIRISKRRPPSKAGKNPDSPKAACAAGSPTQPRSGSRETGASSCRRCPPGKGALRQKTIASLDILHHEHDEAYRKKFADMLREASKIFWQLPHVGDVRQEGGVLAIELVEHFATRKKFDPHKKLGAAVCVQAAELGLLTRPVGDCLVLMPPLCAKQSQIELMCELLHSAISKTLLK